MLKKNRFIYAKASKFVYHKDYGTVYKMCIVFYTMDALSTHCPLRGLLLTPYSFSTTTRLYWIRVGLAKYPSQRPPVNIWHVYHSSESRTDVVLCTLMLHTVLKGVMLTMLLILHSCSRLYIAGISQYLVCTLRVEFLLNACRSTLLVSIFYTVLSVQLSKTC